MVKIKLSLWDCHSLFCNHFENKDSVAFVSYQKFLVQNLPSHSLTKFSYKVNSKQVVVKMSDALQFFYKKNENYTFF